MGFIMRGSFCLFTRLMCFRNDGLEGDIEEVKMALYLHKFGSLINVDPCIF
jgi:hypothetical protein